MRSPPSQPGQATAQPNPNGDLKSKLPHPAPSGEYSAAHYTNLYISLPDSDSPGTIATALPSPQHETNPQRPPPPDSDVKGIVWGLLVGVGRWWQGN